MTLLLLHQGQDSMSSYSNVQHRYKQMLEVDYGAVILLRKKNTVERFFYLKGFLPEKKENRSFAQFH